MLSTADKASRSDRAHNSEQGHSLKMADEILDALQKIDARGVNGNDAAQGRRSHRID
jgi:hypothetical protein